MAEIECKAVNRKYCRAVCNCWVVVKRKGRPDYCTRELYPLITGSDGYCGLTLVTLKGWYGLKKAPPKGQVAKPKGQAKKQGGGGKLKWLG